MFGVRLSLFLQGNGEEDVTLKDGGQLSSGLGRPFCKTLFINRVNTDIVGLVSHLLKPPLSFTDSWTVGTGRKFRFVSNRRISVRKGTSRAPGN